MRLNSVIAGGLVLLAASPAIAYECSRVPPAGPSLYWDTRLLTYTVNQEGCDDIDGDAEFDAMAASFSTWAAIDGSDIAFAQQPRTSATLAGYNWRDAEDNQNLMVWRHGDVDDPIDGWRHEFGSIAVTTTTFNSRTGELLDADIEFNSTRYSFTACTPPAPGCSVSYDVQNTATHEIGHVLGLDHPPGDQPGVEETTMYLSAPRGEVKKRDLDADDEAGIRFIYPAGQPVQQCYPPLDPGGPDPSFTQVGYNADDGCWCGAGGNAGGMGSLLLFLVGLARATGFGRRSRWQDVVEKSRDTARF